MDLKIRDVAQLLGVSETTIRRWLADRKIPAYRLNHQYRFSRIEIENWMVQCKLKSNEPTALEERQIYPLPSAEEQSQRNGHQQFCLYRAIHQGDVYNDLPGATKEELIRNTTEVIATKLAVDSDMLCELLLDREELMPTALNNGIAAPHTRDFLRQGPIDRAFVVFPSEPVEYGSLDGRPVHALFFLFASSDKGHLQLLAKLAHLSSDPEMAELLSSRPSKLILLDALRKWESSLSL